MTTKGLCKKAELSDASLYRIQKGSQKPHPATVGRIAAALEVDVTEIIETNAATFSEGK